MAPTSPARTVFAEEALARRVQAFREAQGWSPAGLASRMTKAGCPMSQSSIWKIENPDPETGRRRRITFDEAVTFARVFNESIETLASPADVVAARSVIECVTSINWKIESLTNLLDHEIRVNFADLHTEVDEHAASELVMSALTRATRGEMGDPWSEQRASSADGPLVPLDLDAVVAWLEAKSAELREAAGSATQFAGVFTFWADRRLGLAAVEGGDDGEHQEEA